MQFSVLETHITNGWRGGGGSSCSVGSSPSSSTSSFAFPRLLLLHYSYFVSPGQSKEGERGAKRSLALFRRNYYNDGHYYYYSRALYSFSFPSSGCSSTEPLTHPLLAFLHGSVSQPAAPPSPSRIAVQLEIWSRYQKNVLTNPRTEEEEEAGDARLPLYIPKGKEMRIQLSAGSAEWLLVLTNWLWLSSVAVFLLVPNKREFNGGSFSKPLPPSTGV